MRQPDSFVVFVRLGHEGFELRLLSQPVGHKEEDQRTGNECKSYRIERITKRLKLLVEDPNIGG